MIPCMQTTWIYRMEPYGSMHAIASRVGSGKMLFSKILHLTSKLKELEIAVSQELLFPFQSSRTHRLKKRTYAWRANTCATTISGPRSTLRARMNMTGAFGLCGPTVWWTYNYSTADWMRPRLEMSVPWENVTSTTGQSSSGSQITSFGVKVSTEGQLPVKIITEGSLMGVNVFSEVHLRSNLLTGCHVRLWKASEMLASLCYCELLKLKSEQSRGNFISCFETSIKGYFKTLSNKILFNLCRQSSVLIIWNHYSHDSYN